MIYDFRKLLLVTEQEILQYRTQVIQFRLDLKHTAIQLIIVFIL